MIFPYLIMKKYKLILLVLFIASLPLVLTSCTSVSANNTKTTDKMGAKPQDPDFITDLRIKAEEGSAKAQYNLGVMYTEGEGVIKDYKQAYMYANISSYNGSKEAIKLRELIEKELTAEQINEAQELSREWIKSHK
ncbi:conserved hypothetical protein [Bathymodiolus platifrons methanotrophic gill symbiont]|nr:conserved hypothetical protein [Bathymodiolus platifrons methanotrophic gill symbiont]